MIKLDNRYIFSHTRHNTLPLFILARVFALVFALVLPARRSGGISWRATRRRCPERLPVLRAHTASAANGVRVSAALFLHERVLEHLGRGVADVIALCDIPETNFFEVDEFVVSVVSPTHVKDVGHVRMSLDFRYVFLFLVVCLT